MTIKIGDRLPSGTLWELIEDETPGCTIGPNAFEVDKLVSGKRIAVFGLPGAFTPTCSAKHLPGYLQLADKLKAVKAALRKLRYPRLSQLEDDLRAAIKALDLGDRVRISFPPTLESDEMTFEIKARNIQEIKDSLTQLQQKLDDGALQRVFALMDEV